MSTPPPGYRPPAGGGAPDGPPLDQPAPGQHFQQPGSPPPAQQPMPRTPPGAGRAPESPYAAGVPGWPTARGPAPAWTPGQREQHPDLAPPQGQSPPPQWAAAPYVPAAEAPEIAAARAAQAAHPQVELPRYVDRGQLASNQQRMLAFAFDALLIGVALYLAVIVNPIALVVAGWFIVRYLPLAAFGTTAGGWLCGMSVRGPDLQRLDPARALAQELCSVAGILWVLLIRVPRWSSSRFSDSGSGWSWLDALTWGVDERDATSRELDPRFIGDIWSNTWTLDVPTGARALGNR